MKKLYVALLCVAAIACVNACKKTTSTPPTGGGTGGGGTGGGGGGTILFLHRHLDFMWWVICRRTETRQPSPIKNLKCAMSSTMPLHR
jgi:hypothetical protein